MLIDSAPLLAVIAVASNVGLVSLWIVDQLVYQRLISAVFKIGLELERRNAGWPPIRIPDVGTFETQTRAAIKEQVPPVVHADNDDGPSADIPNGRSDLKCLGSGSAL